MRDVGEDIRLDTLAVRVTDVDGTRQYQRGQLCALLDVLPIDIEHVCGVADAVLDCALDAHLVIVGRIGRDFVQRRISRVADRRFVRWQCVDTPAPEALRPGRVYEVGRVELVGRVDLPQRA